MLSSELRNKIFQYIDSDIGIEELEDWYVPRLSLFLRNPDSADANIIAVIELGLAELQSGLQNEDELRESLLNAIREHKTIISYLDDTMTESASSNQTVTMIGNEAAMTMTPY